MLNTSGFTNELNYLADDDLETGVWLIRLGITSVLLKLDEVNVW